MRKLALYRFAGSHGSALFLSDNPPPPATGATDSPRKLTHRTPHTTSITPHLLELKLTRLPDTMSMIRATATRLAVTRLVNPSQVCAAVANSSLLQHSSATRRSMGTKREIGEGMDEEKIRPGERSQVPEDLSICPWPLPRVPSSSLRHFCCWRDASFCFCPVAEKPTRVVCINPAFRESS